MDTDGVDLVLGRLSNLGCDPRTLAKNEWQAPCPVHGGPYPALLVSRGADGSVSVKCRYLNPNGNFCSEAKIWESLGLPPQRWDRTGAAIGQIDRSDEQDAQPSPLVSGSPLEAAGAASSQPNESRDCEHDENGRDRLIHLVEPGSTWDSAPFSPRTGHPEDDAQAGAEPREARPGGFCCPQSSVIR